MATPTRSKTNEKQSTARSTPPSAAVPRSGAAHRASFERARDVRPTGITGRETAREIIAGKFGAYVGRQERVAYELMRRSFDAGARVFLTMSGAMTPAGLHSSCIIPLIERGIIDCITTTGANLYHDAHRVIGHAIREIDPSAGDLQYRLARIIRIYDLGFWEETLLDTDRLFSAILRQPQFQKRMTTTELHFELGRQIAAIEDALGIKEPTLLATAFRRGVPIFVGAVQDGSIFLNVVKLKRLLGNAFKLEIDINDDVFEMGAMQHHCFGTDKAPMAIWILGGGVPKNYTLQGEPLLDQILGVPTHGFDIDLQFCVDPVDNGALSSCPAGEGHTWGKVSAESVQYGSMYVHCDVTAVFPWLTYTLLSDAGVKRSHTRLYDQRAIAVANLQRAVERRRKQLLPTLEYDLPTKKKTASAKGATGAKGAKGATATKAGRGVKAAKKKSTPRGR